MPREDSRITRLLFPPQFWGWRAASAQALTILHLFLSFFPSLLPLQTLGEENEEKHTSQEAFPLHCVFQLDLNRRPSIQPALTLPPLFSLVLFVFFFFFFSPLSDYVFRLRKEQLSSVAWGYKKLQLPVASTTWLWRLKGQEAMEPIWILGETPQLNPFCPNSGSAAMSHAETLIPHFLWPSTFWRPPPSPDKGFSSQVWGNQASWTWNQWRRRNTPFPFQSSLVGLFFSQQGDSKLAGLSKLQISMFPALAKGKFAG